jgi:hypothetical protein
MLRKFYVQATGGFTVGHGVQHLGTGQVVLFWNSEKLGYSIQILENLKVLRRSLPTEEDGLHTEIVWNDDHAHPAGKGLIRNDVLTA